MEQVINSPEQEIIKKKFYTSRAIGYATFFAGPLIGAYLMSQNFRALGNKKFARNTMIIGTTFTILLICAILLIPQAVLDRLPNIALSIAYTLAVYGLSIKYQEDTVSEHLKNGDLKHSVWNVIGLVILFAIASLLLGSLCLFFIGLFSPDIYLKIQ